MNQALVQDVVAEVMKRLGNRPSHSGGNGGGGTMTTYRPAPYRPRAGEDAPANEPKFREGIRHPHRVVGSSRVDLQACKLEYSIVSPK